MKPLDYLLLALIALWFLWAVRRLVWQKKRGGCCGCSGCSGTPDPQKTCQGACARCEQAGTCRHPE